MIVLALSFGGSWEMSSSPDTTQRKKWRMTLRVFCPSLSPSPLLHDDKAAAMLDESGSKKPPKGPSKVSEGVSEDVDGTIDVVVLAYCRLICLKG